MLFANPDFDLVLFVTPTENPVKKARKVLHRRFPNIPETEFSESSILSMLRVDALMDLRPYVNENFPIVQRNIEFLKGKSLHPLAQSAFNHFAFVTNVMDSFLRACGGLKDTLGFEQDFSINSQDPLAKAYYEHWLQPMTEALAMISKVTKEAECAFVSREQLKSLYDATSTFSVEASFLLEGNFDDFYDYYDEHYSGQFNSELDNLKQILTFDLAYAIHYIEMLGHAKKDNLLDFIKNPALSSFGDVKRGSKIVCDVMQKSHGISVKNGKSKDIYAELMGFASGYQQIKGRLYNEDAPYSVLSVPAKKLHKASGVFCLKVLSEMKSKSLGSLFHYQILEIQDWNKQLGVVLDKDTSEISYADSFGRFDSRQDMHEWLSNAASGWRLHYESESQCDVEDLMSESTRVMTMVFATITTT